jgi:hypothetical protein
MLCFLYAHKYIQYEENYFVFAGIVSLNSQAQQRPKLVVAVDQMKMEYSISFFQIFSNGS